MQQTAVALPKSSTNVRFEELPTALLRWSLRAGAVLAPSAVDRFAARSFFRPRRREVPAPVVPGHTAQAFRLEGSAGRLAAWAWGEGPTVLLAHGWEGHAGQLAPFVAPLVQSGYRVVAFDMPAHGRSEGTHASVLDMARALCEVAEDMVPFRGFDAEPLHAVVAHSLAGAATVRALTQGLQAHRAVLLAPVAEPLHFARRVAAFLQLPPERADAFLHNVVATIGGDVRTVDARLLAAQLDLPGLVFHDPEDREVPFLHGQEIARRWQGAELVTLEGLGHRRLLKDAAVVERTVRFVTGRELRLAQTGT